MITATPKAEWEGMSPNGFQFDGTEAHDIDYALNRGIDLFYMTERRSAPCKRIACRATFRGTDRRWITLSCTTPHESEFFVDFTRNRYVLPSPKVLQ